MKSLKFVAVMMTVTFVTLSCVVILQAQQGGAKRTVLKQQDITGFAGHEGAVVLVELAPGAKEPRHTHPGDLFGYVQEGAIALTLDGQPTITVKAGEVFFVPAGRIHWGENAGATPLKVIATFVVEKGKPLASPAP